MDNGVRIKVICGDGNGIKGPLQDIVANQEYLDVTAPPETSFTHPTKPGYTVFAYVLEGEGSFGKDQDPYSFEVEGAKYFDLNEPSPIGPENLVMFGYGDEMVATAGNKGLRFLLVSGKPINEPVA